MLGLIGWDEEYTCRLMRAVVDPGEMLARGIRLIQQERCNAFYTTWSYGLPRGLHREYLSTCASARGRDLCRAGSDHNLRGARAELCAGYHDRDPLAVAALAVRRCLRLSALSTPREPVKLLGMP